LMRRRHFLQAAGAAGLGLALPACRRLEHLGIPVRIFQPGLAEGHRLRDAGPLLTPTRALRTGVAILGSGVAGLTAAW
ncbi:twin-arginine translocation signal domain-containing protein, partial [Bacillus sp. SIMBA_069]